MTRSNRVGVPALLAIMLLAAQAAAQPSTVEAARALHVEGKELRRAGDLRASLEKLEAAHALYATPITALEVGRGHALLGGYKKAIEVLASIDALPVKPDASARSAAARNEAQTLLVQYRARLARLVLRVDGDGARVRVDGVLVPAEALGAPWPVDPGVHHVEAERGAQHTADDVPLGEGEERALTLHLDPPAPQPPAPAPVAPPAIQAPIASPAPIAAPPAAPAERSTSPLVYVGLGVGGVGLVAGAITGAVTLSRAATLKQDCQNGRCLPAAGLETTKTLGDVSTASFIIGGAGIGLAVGALLVGRARAAPPRGAWLRPWIGGTGAGVGGAF